MREIKFRGKRIDNGGWVEGSLLKVTLDAETYYLIFGDEFLPVGADVRAMYHACVDPETVGQFTGLTDNRGTKIYDGDIMRFTNPEGDSSIYVIQWMQCSCICGWVARFMSLPDDDGDPLDDFFCSMSEVIGNIHDNPELLKGEIE